MSRDEKENLIGDSEEEEQEQVHQQASEQYEGAVGGAVGGATPGASGSVPRPNRLPPRRFFGSLIQVRGRSYAAVIDGCPSGVILILHIYKEENQDCVHLNGCLARLARVYPTVKMCRVEAAALQLTQEFLENGLPYFIIYKNGEIIGNFPRVAEDLGKDCELEVLERFLRMKGCLPGRNEREDEDDLSSSGGALKLLGLFRGRKN